jgi:hypothetical protein
MSMPKALLTVRTGETQSSLDGEDPIRFAVFRISLGITLLADISHLFLNRGIFPVTQKWQVPISLFLIPWAVVLVCMIAGYRARLAAIANYCFCGLVLGLIAPLYGFTQVAGDSVAIGASLLAVILPCGGALAYDRIGSPPPALET